MDSGPWQVVKTFSDRASADLAVGELQSSGIPARLNSPDAEGLWPTTSGFAQIALYVPPDQLDRARHVLDSESDADHGPAASSAPPAARSPFHRT